MKCDDRQLVNRIQEGDVQAFAQLYDRYAGLIRAVCYGTTRNLNDAQDLSQEVFMRAYRDIKKLRDPGRVGAWLVGMAKMVGREWLRQHVKRNRFEQTLDSSDFEVASRTPDDCPETFEQLHLCIARLPERERMALHLFYLGEQSAQRARSVLGLSRSGFYKLLGKAKENLAIQMSKQECLR